LRVPRTEVSRARARGSRLVSVGNRR
jgi:hypothetical protein